MGFWNFLLNRWTILAIGALFMLIGLKPDWTVAVVRAVGMMGWAENKMGRGSTYNIWKIIGIIAPIAAIIYFFSPGITFDDPGQDQNSINSSQYLY